MLTYARDWTEKHVRQRVTKVMAFLLSSRKIHSEQIAQPIARGSPNGYFGKLLKT
jgi:hypothetical protein